MGWLVASSVVAGVLAGAWGLVPRGSLPAVGSLADVARGALLLGVGVEIGQSETAWRTLRRLGPRVLWVPVAVAAGSLAGAVIAGWGVGLTPSRAAVVGAGFGWYSLSGVMVARLVNLDLGTLAFLANLLRELLALLVTPLVARSLGGIAASAPGGATTMDVTLPVVARAVGPEGALVAFVSGAVLSGLVPVLVTVLARL